MQEVGTERARLAVSRLVGGNRFAASGRWWEARFSGGGRAKMAEFAYSGLGMTPLYAAPRSPFDRATGRVSGGSTSGGAGAVADGMAHAALGTDTGGSCRIPAAFCGIVGYHATARSVPRRPPAISAIAFCHAG